MTFLDAGRVRVFLRPGATDMRKSISGLSAAAQEIMKCDPLSGNLFAFCNKRKSHIKILFWDRNGFCLWLKRLDKDRFKWPCGEAECLELTPEQLGWLLRGLDYRTAHAERIFSSLT